MIFLIILFKLLVSRLNSNKLRFAQILSKHVYTEFFEPLFTNRMNQYE